MAFPKYKPDYKGESRKKLISKKIKLLKKEGKPQKQAVAIAVNMYPKRKRLPLAWTNKTSKQK